MGTEYYHTLIEKGGKVLGYGNVITENDWQIMGNENNRAICPPEEKWIGYKTIPFPHPMFVRMPPNDQVQPNCEAVSAAHNCQVRPTPKRGLEHVATN